MDKERKIVFDDMIADIINNKELNPTVTELFITGRKLNTSIVFITQSYFMVPKDVRVNSIHFFIMKIPSKRELQRSAKNMLPNHILFLLMMLRLRQIIL